MIGRLCHIFFKTKSPAATKMRRGLGTRHSRLGSHVFFMKDLSDHFRAVDLQLGDGCPAARLVSDQFHNPQLGNGLGVKIQNKDLLGADALNGDGLLRGRAVLVGYLDHGAFKVGVVRQIVTNDDTYLLGVDRATKVDLQPLSGVGSGPPGLNGIAAVSDRKSVV